MAVAIATSLFTSITTAPDRWIGPGDSFSTLVLDGLVNRSAATSVSPDRKVIPGGQTVGVQINVDGVLVLGFTEIETAKGTTVCPARESKLQEGDIIKKINDTSIQTVDDMGAALQRAGASPVRVEVLRDEQTMAVEVTPSQAAKDSTWKLGAWVRDSTSGIGTLTFVEPDSNVFGALGHPIVDGDINEPIAVGSGNVLSSNIVGINKGERGSPGEIRGTFTNDLPLGNIEKNTDFGIYGTLQSAANKKQAIPIAMRDEIRTGVAHILCNLDGTEVKSYEIEIQKINRNATDNKGMLIKVTDPALLEKTGGIVQGMSGSPIIQDDKLVGAVTHVLVNDPTRGYGIFIELMIEKADE